MGAYHQDFHQRLLVVVYVAETFEGLGGYHQLLHCWDVLGASVVKLDFNIFGEDVVKGSLLVIYELFEVENELEDKIEVEPDLLAAGDVWEGADEHK